MVARARSCFPVRPVAANRDPCPKAVSGQHSSQALARQLCHLLPRPPSPQQEVRTITEQAAELRHPDQAWEHCSQRTEDYLGKATLSPCPHLRGDRKSTRLNSSH